MSLKDKIAHRLCALMDDEWEEGRDLYRSDADAILALVKAHLTSDEAVERACDSTRAFNPDMAENWREVWDPEDVDHFVKLIRAATLAALGDAHD